MKKLILVTILFISFLSSTSWSETLTIDDLVLRNDLYYKKFTNVPFNGEVSGIESGKFKNGIKDGEWLRYNKNGQLEYKGNYKYGRRDGPTESYNENGQLILIGRWKSGKREGLWNLYHDNGNLEEKINWKDGERINCEGDC